MMDERERRITARAFELRRQEGSLDGRSLSHWLQAEKEIDEEGGEVGAEDRPNRDRLGNFAKSAKTSTWRVSGYRRLVSSSKPAVVPRIT